MPDSLPKFLPSEITALKAVAKPFLAAFGNCTSPESQDKHAPEYATALGIFRSRNCSTAVTWRAFCDAWLAQNGKPLFGAAAKSAVAFLQSSKPKPIVEATRISQGWLRGEDGRYRPWTGVFGKEPPGFSSEPP